MILLSARSLQARLLEQHFSLYQDNIPLKRALLLKQRWWVCSQHSDGHVLERSMRPDARDARVARDVRVARDARDAHDARVACAARDARAPLHWTCT